MLAFQKPDADLKSDLQNLKSHLDSIPGGVKMVCSSVALGLILWTLMQFGSQSVMMAAIDAGYALKTPVLTIQSYLETEWPDSSVRLKRALRRIPPLGAKELESTVEFAQTLIMRQARHESNIADSGFTVHDGTPGQGQLIESLPSPDALRHARDAMVALKASQQVAAKYCVRLGIDNESCAKQLTGFSLRSTSLGKNCASYYKSSVYCSELNVYRSTDGSCNHKGNVWGQSLTPYRRLLPAWYDDGLHAMRGSRKGRPIVSPRVVSTALVTNVDAPDVSKTLAVVQWGQFVAHDMGHTVASRMLTNGKTISCCSETGRTLAPRSQHPSCAPIEISHSDPFFSKLRHTCMPYVRSIAAIRPDCSFGPVEQMNQATHYLDGSTIYGSTEETAKSLRAFRDGRLRATVHGLKDYMPPAKQPDVVCLQNESCYESGDVRVNANPGLASLHTLWLREHNRIAERLGLMQPTWDDERLFQEARRIVIAEIQHITYNEWLPVVVGVKYMNKAGLSIKKNTHSARYNERVDATVSNAFATAAMAFINSMVEGRLRLYEEDRNPEMVVMLKEVFNRPNILEHGSRLESIVRGLATQSSQMMDLQYADAVHHYLFQGNEEYGLDRLSLDIQRGRDHGLPGYNEYRAFCGLPRAQVFSDFTDTIPKETVAKLSKLYKNVDEVDLVVGGIAESHEDGLVGATFKCLLSEQFLRTRTGDRFFYDVGSQAGSFSEAQLLEIKKANLARIFCDNSDIMNMQPSVFDKPSTPGNDLVPCSETLLIERVDLEPWREIKHATLLS